VFTLLTCYNNNQIGFVRFFVVGPAFLGSGRTHIRGWI